MGKVTTILQKIAIMRLSLLILLILISSNISSQNKSFNPDISINGIELFDTTSLKTTIPDISKYIDYRGPGHKAQLLNKLGDEQITLFFHAGGYRYQTAEIKVSTLTDTINCIHKIQTIDKFKTENGVELYIDKETLISILGNNYKMKTDTSSETETIIYLLNDFKNSDFLQTYNMPEYYSKYKFKNERLIEFGFGFTYP